MGKRALLPLYHIVLIVSQLQRHTEFGFPADETSARRVIFRRPYSRVATTVMFLFAITIVFVDCAPGATGAGGQKHSTALGR